MTVSVVHGTNSKPAGSARLVEAFVEASHLDGELLLGFPLFGAQSESASADAIYLSQAYGAVLIDVVEGSDLGAFEARQDDVARMLQARLFQHKELVERRRLSVEPDALTFAPALSDLQVREMDTEYFVANGSNLLSVLESMQRPRLSDDRYAKLLSAVQNISTLRRARRPRNISEETSRGGRLQRLEAQIATLDPRQSEAVLETIEGPQRIRGLAGSGKTIVLALKAAYLHSQHPEWQIGVTYNTRSLHDQFIRLINGFSIEQAGEEPDWTRLRVLNAWGGKGSDRSGLYYEFCQAHNIEAHTFLSAQQKWGRDDAFGEACAEALKMATSTKKLYDVILIDEAQDVPAEFLRLCYEMLSDSKRLVYAYDELQNLSGTAMESTLEIFGENAAGEAIVDFEGAQNEAGPRRDIVLEKCYRNSRPVLVTAHALGFGVYRRTPKTADTPLVQMFDQPGLWGDVGYRVASGRLDPGHAVVLERTESSSPKFLEQHSTSEDLIQFKAFSSLREQNDWVANQIQTNIREDELRHDDIVVINPNPLTTRANVGPIRKQLAERDIDSHLAGVDTSSDVFFARERDSITFTGVFRAKGNEAGMVYVVNAEEGVGSLANLALVRNRLFTAITRSKAWVRVVGVGSDMNRLIDEFERAKAEHYRLKFDYPTESQSAAIRILHREVLPGEESLIAQQRESAKGLLQELEGGRLFPEDLDSGLRARLRAMLEDRDE